jgi:thymidine kinase
MEVQNIIKKRSPWSLQYGHLYLIIGPMFSGKTSSLISELTRFVDVGIPSLYINSDLDTRNREYSTHNSSYAEVTNKILKTKTNLLSEVSKECLDKVDVIAIDEAQFFSDLLEVVPNWMKLGKIIYVAGLDGDCEQRPFGSILQLIPYCTKVKKLLSVCEICRRGGEINKAPYTLRKEGKKELIEIGGADKYIPVCYSHLSLIKEFI